LAKLRKLRVALAIAEGGAIANAARQLGLSQPAVSRALQSLEAELGITLFHRSSRRLAASEAGILLVRRIGRAQEQLRIAELELPAMSGEAARSRPSLTIHAADHEFAALLAVAAHGTVSAGARQAGLSQPALNRSLRALENRAGLPLFHRTTAGMRLTPPGEALLRRVKLCFSEIRQGLEEVEILKGATGGQIRIGALPLTRVRLAPVAVERLLMRYPEAEIAIVDGTYGSLLMALRQGDIDVLVGTIRRPAPVEGIVSEELFEDDVVMVVGARHPLAGRRSVDLADCLGFPWVLPFKGVPLRLQFEAALRAFGLDTPKRVIETDSVVAVRTLLMNGERVAILSRHQVHHEVEAGTLTILPVRIECTNRQVGLTMRADYVPTPLAAALLDELRGVAAEISEARPHAPA